MSVSSPPRKRDQQKAAETDQPPPGFQTIESLGNWPGEILGRFFGVAEDEASPARAHSSHDAKLDHREAFLRRRRVEALLQRGVALHTDFSGKGSVETTLRSLDKAGKDTCFCDSVLGLLQSSPP